MKVENELISDNLKVRMIHEFDFKDDEVDPHADAFEYKQ